MAAIATTLQSLLGAGDRIMIQANLYGGTHELVHGHLTHMGVGVDTFDIDADPASWLTHLKPRTKVIYVEMFSNPLLQVPDLAAVVSFAKAHDLTSVIDNTFGTPVNIRPLFHGFDIVVHSATKFLNGHSDVIAGAIAGSAQLVTKVRDKLEVLGGCLDPHACFLLQRGLKTLALRVQRQNRNALALSTFLQQHPKVSRVNYPGLPGHARHEQLRELMLRDAAVGRDPGFGGVFSFELAGGVAAAECFMSRLRLALVAPSLGGVETLVTRPAATSHAKIGAAERAALGICEGLVRVAVGVEDGEDLVADFGAALAALEEVR